MRRSVCVGCGARWARGSSVRSCRGSAHRGWHECGAGDHEAEGEEAGGGGWRLRAEAYKAITAAVRAVSVHGLTARSSGPGGPWVRYLIATSQTRTARRPPRPGAVPSGRSRAWRRVEIRTSAAPSAKVPPTPGADPRARTAERTRPPCAGRELVVLLDDRKCRSASPTGPSRTQNKPDGETVRRVVRPLAALRERPNGGDPPADQRQVERRDRHATDDTPGGLASVRQSGAHDRRPADRDREMNGHRGGQQHRCTLLMWEQHRAGGAAPFQDVLPSDQRPRRGGDRRTRRSSQPGCQGSHGSPARRRLTRPSCQAPDDFSKRQSALSPDRQAAGRRVARPSAARSRAAHKGGRTMSPSGRSQAARASRRLPKEGRRH